jgi:hypothetical protein
MRKVSNMTGSQRTLLTDPVDIDGDVARAPSQVTGEGEELGGSKFKNEVEQIVESPPMLY